MVASTAVWACWGCKSVRCAERELCVVCLSDFGGEKGKGCMDVFLSEFWARVREREKEHDHGSAYVCMCASWLKWWYAPPALQQNARLHTQKLSALPCLVLTSHMHQLQVYHPSVLMTKKRYVGMMFESPGQQEPTFDAKGIETVRRDTCPAVAKTLERSLRILFASRDISQVPRLCPSLTLVWCAS